jgi:SAM-dependent methyltransferase
MIDNGAPKPRKLNLGCGEFKKPGYVNLDIEGRGDPDVIHDLNDQPFPFEDGAFDLIESSHNLEHLSDPFKTMVEMHRLLAPGGKLHIKVPHFSRGFTHADHRRGFDVSFAYYFNPAFSSGYTGTTFELEKLRLVWYGQPYMKAKFLSPPVHRTLMVLGTVFDMLANLSPAFCSRIWCFWVGGFEEMDIRLKKPLD